MADDRPAFPTYDGRQYIVGMTLRDYFAGQALTGICAGICAKGESDSCAANRMNFESAAIDAYAISDRMLNARKS